MFRLVVAGHGSVLRAVDLLALDVHHDGRDLGRFALGALGLHGVRDHAAHVHGQHAVHDVDGLILGKLLLNRQGDVHAELVEQVLEAGQAVQAALLGHHAVELEQGVVEGFQLLVGGIDGVAELGHLVGLDGVAILGQVVIGVAVDGQARGLALAAVDHLREDLVALGLQLGGERRVLHGADQTGIGGDEFLGQEGHQLGIAVALRHLALHGRHHLVGLLGQGVQRLGGHLHGHVVLLEQGGDAAVVHAQLDGEQRVAVHIHAQVEHGLLAVRGRAQAQGRIQRHRLVAVCKDKVMQHQGLGSLRRLALAADPGQHHGEAEQDRKEIHGHRCFLLLFSLRAFPAFWYGPILPRKDIEGNAF